MTYLVTWRDEYGTVKDYYNENELASLKNFARMGVLTILKITFA